MDEIFENNCVYRLSKPGNIKIKLGNTDNFVNVTHYDNDNNNIKTKIQLSYEMWKRVEEIVNVIKKFTEEDFRTLVNLANILLSISTTEDLLLQLTKQKECGEKECKILKDNILQTISVHPEILIEAIKERVRQREVFYRCIHL